MDEQSVTSPLSKGSKTKEKILKHALKLFATKGYKATTVRDIAGAVGIKQSALYNHFKNKDEILETLICDLTSSAIVTLFDNKESIDKGPLELHKQGKSLLMSIATTFKLLSFDGQNEALFKLLMQEIFRNERIEFFSPLFFYQMQVSLLKLDKKSTSSVVSLFEKHVELFWDNVKVEKQTSLF